MRGSRGAGRMSPVRILVLEASGVLVARGVGTFAVKIWYGDRVLIGGSALGDCRDHFDLWFANGYKNRNSICHRRII